MNSASHGWQGAVGHEVGRTHNCGWGPWALDLQNRYYSRSQTEDPSRVGASNACPQAGIDKTNDRASEFLLAPTWTT